MPTNINGNTGIDKVQDGTVVSADIATLDASKLTGSIAAARIASNTIDSAHIASGAVDDAHLATGITASKLTGTIADARFPSTLPAASAANLTAIPAANLTGTVATARLGTGTGGTGNFLRGDGSWQAAGSTSATDLTSGTLNRLRLPAGSVLQTGTGTKTGEYDMNSGTLTDIPSMNVTLTPSAQGSKFLVMVAIAGIGRHSGCNAVKFNLQRTISGVGTTHRLIHGNSTHEGSSVNVFGFSVASMLLDVPNTTSNITWTVQNASANSTGYARINSNHGTNTVFSSITVQEIGA